ncbi:hypothetical protein ABTW72_19450 [Micromonospora sp. NPDC127501]|uniref:hypothetical protein n=1 Tax=Micromonospora sp. NPDC127501 TaxID=3154872 RepID=UPI00331A9584
MRDDWIYDASTPEGFDEFRRKVGGISPTDPSEYAAQYICAFVDHKMARVIQGDLALNRMHDVSIIAHENDLTSLTKRASLISDRLVLAQALDGQMQTLPLREEKRKLDRYNHGLWQRQQITVRSVDSRPARSFGLYGESLYNLPELGEYLRDVMPFIETGQMIYQPDIEVSTWTYDDNPDSLGSGDLGNGPASSDELVKLRNLVDFLTVGRRVFDSAPSAASKLKLLQPMLQVEIPYLEGTSLRDYCSIATGESEHFRTAQSYLRSILLQLDSVTDDEASLSSARLSSQIEEALRSLRSESKAMLRRNAVRASGAVLATATASLVAITGPELAAIIPILGVSGGAWSIVSAVDQYWEERSKLRQQGVYFFWLLQKNAEKAL